MVLPNKHGAIRNVNQLGPAPADPAWDWPIKRLEAALPINVRMETPSFFPSGTALAYDMVHVFT